MICRDEKNTMNTPLQDSLATLVTLQREQVRQLQRTNVEQKQYFSDLRHTLKYTDSPRAPQNTHAENTLTRLAQGQAKQQAKNFDQAMRHVIVDLGKEWQHFGRKGEMSLERLGKQLGTSLMRILQRTISEKIMTSFSIPSVLQSSVNQGIGVILGGIFHHGGTVNERTASNTWLPSDLFRHSPRLHQGGKIGLGIGPAEYPAILQRGETVLPRTLSTIATPPKVEINIHNAPSEARTTQKHHADGGLQIDVFFENMENRMGQRLSRGEGLASVIENRYNLRSTPLR